MSTAEHETADSTNREFFVRVWAFGMLSASLDLIGARPTEMESVRNRGSFRFSSATIPNANYPEFRGSKSREKYRSKVWV
jgi:hypothetical protein